jgi:hypothetical protein
VYKKFDSAGVLESWLANPQIQKLYEIKFVDWTENKVIVEGKALQMRDQVNERIVDH